MLAMVTRTNKCTMRKRKHVILMQNACIRRELDITSNQYSYVYLTF